MVGIWCEMVWRVFGLFRGRARAVVLCSDVWYSRCEMSDEFEEMVG